MVDLIYIQSDIFGDFYYKVEGFKEWETYIISVMLFSSNWHISREFEAVGISTNAELTKKCEYIFNSIGEIKKTCGPIHKNEVLDQ